MLPLGWGKAPECPVHEAAQVGTVCLAWDQRAVRSLYGQKAGEHLERLPCVRMGRESKTQGRRLNDQFTVSFCAITSLLGYLGETPFEFSV